MAETPPRLQTARESSADRCDNRKPYNWVAGQGQLNAISSVCKAIDLALYLCADFSSVLEILSGTASGKP